MVRMTVDNQNVSKDESKPRVNENVNQSEKRKGDANGLLIVRTDESNINAQSESLSKKSDKSEKPDCSICLTRISTRAYADPCLHEFCRQCLEKWSEVSNKCPLCRRTYISIIHTVRSATEYERIPVLNQSNNGGTGMLLTDENMGLLFTPLDSGIYMVNPRQTPHGIQQNILFLAPNQNFVLENLNPNTAFVRPENFNHILNQS